MTIDFSEIKKIEIMTEDMQQTVAVITEDEIHVMWPYVCVIEERDEPGDMN